MEFQPGTGVIAQPQSGVSFTGKDLSTLGLAQASAELPRAKKMKARGWRQTCYFFWVSWGMQRARMRKGEGGQARRLLLPGG